MVDDVVVGFEDAVRQPVGHLEEPSDFDLIGKGAAWCGAEVTVLRCRAGDCWSARRFVGPERRQAGAVRPSSQTRRWKL
jgi:hypothetical protein